MRPVTLIILLSMSITAIFAKNFNLTKDDDPSAFVKIPINDFKRMKRFHFLLTFLSLGVGWRIPHQKEKNSLLDEWHIIKNPYQAKILDTLFSIKSIFKGNRISHRVLSNNIRLLPFILMLLLAFREESFFRNFSLLLLLL